MRNGIRFTGDGSGISVLDDNSLKLTQSMTIEAWIKIQGLNLGHSLVVFRGDDRPGLDPYFLSVEPDGKGMFLISDQQDTTATLKTKQALPQNRWLHLAATLNHTTGRMVLYVNGAWNNALTTSIRPFADLSQADEPGLGIGHHPFREGEGNEYSFIGVIDEVRILNKALSSTAVKTRYNATK